MHITRPSVHTGDKHTFCVTLIAIIQGFRKYWKSNPSTRNTQIKHSYASSRYTCYHSHFLGLSNLPHSLAEELCRLYSNYWNLQKSTLDHEHTYCNPATQISSTDNCSSVWASQTITRHMADITSSPPTRTDKSEFQQDIKKQKGVLGPLPSHLLRKKKSCVCSTETQLLGQLTAGKYENIKSLTTVVAVSRHATPCVSQLKATRFIFLFRSWLYQLFILTIT